MCCTVVQYMVGQHSSLNLISHQMSRKHYWVRSKLNSDSLPFGGINGHLFILNVQVGRSKN